MKKTFTGFVALLLVAGSLMGCSSTPDPNDPHNKQKVLEGNAGDPPTAPTGGTDPSSPKSGLTPSAPTTPPPPPSSSAPK